MIGAVKKDQVRRQATATLIAAGQPDRCSRCHGGPGDPSCGKTIHIILDSHFTVAAMAAGLTEEQALELSQEDDE